CLSRTFTRIRPKSCFYRSWNWTRGTFVSWARHDWPLPVLTAAAGKALSIPEVSLYTHLVDILCFFVRQHMFRSKMFILSENLPTKISLLLRSPEKQLKLGS